jgi:hypothetical protein
VDVEYCARFPWSGGRHPWLDAVVETAAHLIGVESKRFEPYRGQKRVSLAASYDRKAWGEGMRPYETMRDNLRSGAQMFQYLDAVQLVKHAFGLVTDARRNAKEGVLLYLFAEPPSLKGRSLEEDFAGHRSEITRFSEAVSGSAIRFHAVSYRDWLKTWPDRSKPIAEHRAAILGRFCP